MEHFNSSKKVCLLIYVMTICILLSCNSIAKAEKERYVSYIVVDDNALQERTIKVQDNKGILVSGAKVLLIANDNTYVGASTSDQGIAKISFPQKNSYTIYIVAQQLLLPHKHPNTSK